MVPLSRTRSSSLARNISGPIVLGSAAARERSQRARKWFLRLAATLSFVVLVPVVVYLSVSVVQLRQALQNASVEKQRLASQLLTAKHRNVRRNIGKLPAQIEYNTNHHPKQTLVLTTKLGDVRIVLRPDLSKESVEYMHETVQTGCHRCHLYRAEQPGVLQGVLEGETTNSSRDIIPRGKCPAGHDHIPNSCPSPEDASCGCHGPIMTRGMVAWAAGLTGPDFFINDYARPATWWGTVHTVFGEIQDDTSFAVIDEIWKLPTHKIDVGFTHLDELLPFKITIEQASSVVEMDQ